LGGTLAAIRKNEVEEVQNDEHDDIVHHQRSHHLACPQFHFKNRWYEHDQPTGKPSCQNAHHLVQTGIKFEVDTEQSAYEAAKHDGAFTCQVELVSREHDAYRQTRKDGWDHSG